MPTYRTESGSCPSKLKDKMDIAKFPQLHALYNKKIGEFLPGKNPNQMLTALSILKEHPVTQKELAQDLGLQQSAANKLATLFCKADFIEREQRQGGCAGKLRLSSCGQTKIAEFEAGCDEILSAGIEKGTSLPCRSEKRIERPKPALGRGGRNRRGSPRHLPDEHSLFEAFVDPEEAAPTLEEPLNQADQVSKTDANETPGAAKPKSEPAEDGTGIYEAMKQRHPDRIERYEERKIKVPPKKKAW